MKDAKTAKKILIVEDERAYLDLLTAELTRKGYRVIEAMDGKSGLAQAKNEHPDLILLDISMPLLDGMTMLSLLRKDKQIKKTKVILLTNLEPDDEIIGEVLNEQPAYYFIKSDIKLVDLLERVGELTSK